MSSPRGSGLGARDSGLGAQGSAEKPEHAQPVTESVGTSAASRTPSPESRLLEVTHLTTGFDLDGRNGRFVPAVIDISFSVAKGETLCLVGESGSGKSLTALSIMRLVQAPGRIASGQIIFEGRDLLTLSEREMQTLLKIASGQRQTDIAQELMLSPKTVSVYRARVLEKLGMGSNAELTAYAIKNGLIDTP